MQYHLVLTERCNKRCTYCGGTRHVDGLPLARRMIDEGVLDAGAFDYPEINNGCEIIP